MALTLEERLAEAETAYHDLQIGKAVVEVRDSSGESIRYTMANASRLRHYIATLKNEIAAAPSRGPMRPVFGA